MAHPVNLEVVKKDGESEERLIRRFMKKFKASDIIDLCRRHMVYEKPSDKRKRKKKHRDYIIQKLQEERGE